MNLTDDALDTMDDVVSYVPRSDSDTSDDLPTPYITLARASANVRDRKPNYLKAQDLPHTLQDHLNALPAAYRATEMARTIFEAAIRESSVNDEPHAPLIEVFNPVDDEVTPAWEFHYTNQMWHGDGVPGPDLKNLQGCDCEGTCDPKSKTCLCIKKQSEYTSEYISGFVYDAKGRLKEATTTRYSNVTNFVAVGTNVGIE